MALDLTFDVVKTSAISQIHDVLTSKNHFSQFIFPCQHPFVAKLTWQDDLYYHVDIIVKISRNNSDSKSTWRDKLS